MDLIFVKYVHILSSTFLFGTGVGTAFYLLCASLSQDTKLIAGVARMVVVADWVFTATTIILQPLTGLYLARQMGIPLLTPWLYWSLVLYGIAVLCWLPVVWLQMKLRDIAVNAAATGQPLPKHFASHLGAWAALGVPALISFLAIFFMMVAKRVPFLG